MHDMHYYDDTLVAVDAAPVLFIEANNKSAQFEECINQVIAQSVAG